MYGDHLVSRDKADVFVGTYTSGISNAAGSTDVAKVRAAAAKLDKPLNAYPNGNGAKFDDKFQNTRTFPTVIQWQAGKQVTVFPAEARAAGIALTNTPRK